MKKLISLLLISALLTATTAAFADNDNEKRAVIGADLTASQREEVYEAFGIERGDVPEITMTHADERQYLEGYVSEELLGTRSISSVYIELLPEGEGLDVTAINVNRCAPEMYINALATAGITDARVIVAAPFEVSGTAALAGVYLAYEDITGNKLDEIAKLAGTQELAVTAALADELGSLDSTTIVNELKGMLTATAEMTDEELKAEIREIADKYSIEINDKQIDTLVSLCRSLEKLDGDALRERVENVKETVRKMADAKTAVEGFFAKVRQVVNSVIDFFKDIFARFA